MAPRIKGWWDLYYLAEEFNNADGAFLDTIFAYIDSDDHAYFGQIKKAKLQITLEEASTVLEPIDDAVLYPGVNPDLPQAPDDDVDAAPGTTADVPRYFIKRPPIGNYKDYKGWDALDVIPETLLQEAFALHDISQHEHPNIVKFYGCRVRRGRITGLVLHAYENTLKEALREGGTVDEEKVLAGLEAGLRHLHSIGWAHNDLNPNNVMLNEAGEPILVDFGSCRKIGEKMGATRGTPGWIEEGDDYDISKASHDLHGLEKIREWLKNPTFE